MPRDLPCAACGDLMYRVAKSAPAGLAKCQPCRRKAAGSHARNVAHACGWCGVAFIGKAQRKYCSKACSGKANAPAFVRDASDRRVRRAVRESAAPGLSRSQRNALLRKWKRQGCSCTYCPNQPTTVDHVVPLALGGTNFEGNLVPACRPCNSSKSGLLLAEWRLKGRARLRAVA